MSNIQPLPFNPRWWLTPWWEDAVYQQEYSVSLEQIREHIEALKDLLDEEWTQRALEAGAPNAVVPILYGGQGLIPFQNLMWLARVAYALKSVPSVRRPLESLIGDKTKGALFEMEVASWLTEAGWGVDFLTPGAAKTPDLEITNGGLTCAIECKHLQAEKWEEWAERLSLKIMHRSLQPRPPNVVSHEVLFEPRLSDLVWGDEGIKEGILEELAEKICAARTEALTCDPPRSVQIPGVAQIRIKPDLPGSQYGIGGIEITPQGRMRRIATNAILEGARQLQAYLPGAIVVRTDFIPPESLVDVVLRGVNRADMRLLSSVAVVVITGRFGGSPVIWRNPSMIEDPVCTAVTGAFEQILQQPPAMFRKGSSP